MPPTVSGHLRILTEIWLGHATVADATRRGQIRLTGDRAAVRAFATWFTGSPFAPAGREPLGSPAGLSAGS